MKLDDQIPDLCADPWKGQFFADDDPAILVARTNDLLSRAHRRRPRRCLMPPGEASRSGSGREAPAAGPICACLFHHVPRCRRKGLASPLTCCPAA